MIFALYIFAYVDCKVKTNDSFLFRCSRLIITEEISICLTKHYYSPVLDWETGTVDCRANCKYSCRYSISPSPPVHHIQNLVQTHRQTLALFTCFQIKVFYSLLKIIYYLWSKSGPAILIFG